MDKDDPLLGSKFLLFLLFVSIQLSAIPSYTHLFSKTIENTSFPSVIIETYRTEEKVSYAAVSEEKPPNPCDDSTPEMASECLERKVRGRDLSSKDFIILSAIIRAESNWRQFQRDGSLLRGEVNPKDVGLCQINEDYHLAGSIKEGIDIHTITGNLDYCLKLYEEEGTDPWNASKKKWERELKKVDVNIT